MATTIAPVVPDLSKVVFNPSKSVTFAPIKKKQKVVIEVVNASTCDVALKFKNTNPMLFKTSPNQAKIGVGQKKQFDCFFAGQDKEQVKKNERFTVVCIACSKNAVIEKAWKNAHKTATLKHKIAVVFAGVNDQKKDEPQHATVNDEEEEKDRQGQLRSKVKNDSKKATVVMFTRKDGDSITDEDDEDGTGAGEAPENDLQTTRLAGTFNNQVTSNATNANPASELRTTRPAGKFTGQVGTIPTGAAEQKSLGLKTTKVAGNFTAQATPNATNGPVDDLKTVQPAGLYDNQQKKNAK